MVLIDHERGPCPVCVSCFHVAQLAPAALIVGRLAVVARHERKELAALTAEVESARATADQT